MPWQQMLRTAISPSWPVPEGGWTTPETLEGALIAGPPETIVEVTERYHQLGLDHIVYDLRFHFAEWLDCVQLMGEEVLPRLRREDQHPEKSTIAHADGTKGGLSPSR